MADSLTLTVFLVAIIFLSGALLAATPWFMKKGECFAVTIPESEHADERFISFRKRYAAAVLAVTLVCTVALSVVSSVALGRWVRRSTPLHRTQSSLRQSSQRQRCPWSYRSP